MALGLTVVLALSNACAETLEIREHFLQIEGTTIYAKTCGEGEPLVVVHGGPGFDHRQFLPYIWALAQGRQVILYDQRGTGLSEGPVDSASINIDTFVADLDAVRAAFGIEKMHLLGHSWGGILAMDYALAHPDRLKSLVLCSTTADEAAFGEMYANYTARRAEGEEEQLMAVYRSEGYQAGDPAAYEQFWRMWFRPYFADPAWADSLDLVFTPNTIAHMDEVAGMMMASVGEFDLSGDLASLTCPTLVVHGDADPLPLPYARQLHDIIPGSELVILENAGHWLFVDANDGFRASILDFLDRVDADGP